MKHNYLLTIAIPTYNGSNTISNMMDILMPQITEEIEIIISDNCSTDETPEIINWYRKKYPGIKYIRNENNLGADGNFLQCMKLANGKYTMLISDDDIITEEAITVILLFLKENPDCSLIFLYTVGFLDKYYSINKCQAFKGHSQIPSNSFCTNDKVKFINYVGRQWGFTSSFIWKTDRFRMIDNPERFFNTYWLQSYIHICCSNNYDDQLGVIAYPCIAAGGYGIIGNYDTAKIEGIYYKKMLDYAVEYGHYDKKQLQELWIWKVCFLSSRAIIKEQSIGKHITQKSMLFHVLRKYPYAWFHLFPCFLIPSSLCPFIVRCIRSMQKRNIITHINRPTI